MNVLLAIIAAGAVVGAVTWCIAKDPLRFAGPKEPGDRPWRAAVEVTDLGTDIDGSIWFRTADGRHHDYKPLEHTLWLEEED